MLHDNISLKIEYKWKFQVKHNYNTFCRLTFLTLFTTAPPPTILVTNDNDGCCHNNSCCYSNSFFLPQYYLETLLNDNFCREGEKASSNFNNFHARPEYFSPLWLSRAPSETTSPPVRYGRWSAWLAYRAPLLS